MIRCRLKYALLLGVLVSAASVHAADQARADRLAMQQRVDELLADRWQAEGVTPTTTATDAEFLRRAYLDLTGRIPHVSDVRSFLSAAEPNKRELLIETLLGIENSSLPADHWSRELSGRNHHWTHLANTWRNFLLPDNNTQIRFGFGGAFETWLRGKFADNEPYDKVVTELLLAEGQVNQSGPVLFYSSLGAQPEELATATSRALLGVQIGCAQCHDHPFDHWTRRDFWGFAAFFARLNRAQGAQQFVGNIREGTIGEVNLPDTEEVIPPRYLRGEVAQDEANLGITRRQQLAEWMTAPGNAYFARATVNRVWALMFGRGLVDPVDDLGDHNLPSHPQLLDELATYFVRSGFDLRNLFRTLANTRAYQLSSVSTTSEPTARDLFARMSVKSLTAEQLYDCLEVATLRRAGAGAPSGFASNGRFDQGKIAFLNKFRDPAGSVLDYHAGIPQALTLMNGGIIGDATDLTKSDMLISLEAPFLSDDQRVETLFLAALARAPTEVERGRFVEYVASGDEKQKALSDVLWALLNSAEFTLNH